MGAQLAINRDNQGHQLSDNHIAEPLLSKARLALALGCSVKTVTRRMNRGMPVELRNANRPKFLLSQCKKWLRETYGGTE